MPYFVSTRSYQPIVVLWLVFVLGASSFATQSDVQAPAGSAPSNIACDVGFDGKFKLGCWTPIFFHVSDNEVPQSFVATATDGNGLSTHFRGPVLRAGDSYQGWLKIGRSYGSLGFELFDANDASLGTTNVTLQGPNAATAVEASVPIVLTIESGDELRSTVQALESQLFDEPCEVIRLSEGHQLPVCWLGYEGVRIVYLATSNAGLIDSIQPEQFAALHEWIANGGKLVFCAGRTEDSVFASPDGLSQFLPGTFSGTTVISKSNRIEVYTASNEPLLNRQRPSLVIAKLEQPTGIVELETANHPIVIRKPVGFGQVVFCAVDLDQAPFSEWKGVRNFLLKASYQRLNLNIVAASDNASTGVVRVGYRDLIGQLLLPLEQFSQVRFVNFTVVAILIALFILCIGPADYFLLRRVFGKMELTWLTFSLWIVAFSTLAVLLARYTKPSQMQVNQLEIIDIDASGNRVRGSIWTNIYSPRSDKCDVTTVSRNKLGIDTSVNSTSWMGMPGDGLGGMQSRTSGGLFVQEYDCELEALGTAGQFTSTLHQVPIQVSSTKTLFTQYWQDHDFKIQSRLRKSPESNRLKGTITNPLDVELRDCRLIFENWAYILRRPLAPGETIDVYDEMKERTSAFYFSRREETESDKGGNLPWDPEEKSLPRIAEILMFYQSARGKAYTGLTHGYQNFVDLSEQVNLQRAILFGNVQDVCTPLEIRSSGGEAVYDQSKTFVRMVLPVDFAASPAN